MAFVFKYISCYYLSRTDMHDMSVAVIFKYISCYYLSQTLKLQLVFFLHSNTSHVIIYPRICFVLPYVFLNSNTSHVIIYHSFFYRRFSSYSIQIHLMLLFIQKLLAKQIVQIKFKYISCYYLSLSNIPFSFWHLNSNTSHVIIYRCNVFLFPQNSCNSNTSHVIIYRPDLIKSLCHFSIQIHLMLLFIGMFKQTGCKEHKIQIHLMLLFISNGKKCLTA